MLYNMKSYQAFKKQLLKNSVVQQEYKKLEPEFVLIQALIAKRIECGLTQADLARRIGTKQSAISRLERGDVNPTLGFLKKIAHALHTNLLVSFS